MDAYIGSALFILVLAVIGSIVVGVKIADWLSLLAQPKRKGCACQRKGG